MKVSYKNGYAAFEHIEKISIHKHFFTMLFGRTFKVLSITISDLATEASITLEGDFTLILSRKVLLLIKNEDGKKHPFIIRNIEMKNNISPYSEMIHYQDLDGNTWRFIKTINSVTTTIENKEVMIKLS
ncbi:hypothetical protein V6R21_00280 [Limibacter armeniacum]|uniref:hypothetical protein n=1 Tax=Limibacter armeniacum TaxID=466084 RepID=UPI002FE57353